MTLMTDPGDRFRADRPRRLAGPGGWASAASLFAHGSALAAVLIAAAGSSPQAPPPVIEVAIVTAAAPSQGAAAAQAAATAPVQEAPSALQLADRPAMTAPPVTAGAPSQAEAPIRPADARAELAERMPPPPPPPGRKPDLRLQEVAPPAREAPVEAAPTQPQRAMPAPGSQLAALPEGEMVDSTAAPGSGAASPPRAAGGEKANPPPRYPPAARRRGIEGEVLIRIQVAIDGTAKHVEVARSSGHAVLDRAAIEALARWRFEPARLAGRPVAGTLEVPVNFRLTDAPES